MAPNCLWCYPVLMDAHDDPAPLNHGAAGHPARWWHALADGRIQCDLCPRFCRLREGQRGFCFVRQREGDAMALTAYGRSSGFCVDPIEKKPLNQFYPGTPVLSFGTAGCNLGCRFCQNWTMSRSRDIEAACVEAQPKAKSRDHHRGGQDILTARRSLRDAGAAGNEGSLHLLDACGLA